MRAVTQTHYGNPEDVLVVRDMPAPQPGPGQVRVRVMAASVHADVWHAITGRPFILRLMGSGLRCPSQPIPGTDVAGIVDSVGEGVVGFVQGDSVFGECGIGFQWANAGAYAELACVPQTALAHKPKFLSYEQAAAVPTSGLIALHTMLGAFPLRAGHRVLINGSAGALGSLALQIAKAQGAHVTAVDEAFKLPYLQQLGADTVVDYRSRPVEQLKETFDLIYDVASTLSVSGCRHLFKEGGKLVWIGHDHYGAAGRAVFGSAPKGLGLALAATWDANLSKPIFTAPDRTKGMRVLTGLLAAGQITPVVYKAFALEEAKAAFALLQSGKHQGRIVLVPTYHATHHAVASHASGQPRRG